MFFWIITEGKNKTFTALKQTSNKKCTIKQAFQLISLTYCYLVHTKTHKTRFCQTQPISIQTQLNGVLSFMGCTVATLYN